jgi:hypothetical protein
MISDVVTSITDEVQNLAKEIPQSEATDAVEPKQTDQTHANDGSTKKELYEEARNIGIEGRSTMNKDELLEALDESSSS